MASITTMSSGTMNLTKTDGTDGVGIDAPKEKRPGVPMEIDPPKPMGNSHWTTPAQQRADVLVLTHAARDTLTPVFGTMQPPKGLSGIVRRLAYRIPDHKAKHWLILMMADRIDVQESRIGRTVRNPLAWLLGAGALGAVLWLRRK